jgi:uncharacterized membrane protein
MASTVQIDRYALLPLAGFLIGWGVMGWITRRETIRDRVDCIRAKWVLAVLLIAGIAMMGAMVTLRYATWHSFVFDLGSYDQKTWLISQESSWWGMWQQTYKGGVHLSPCGVDRYWGVCHFQPWLLIPALIYKAWASPLVLLWLQVLLVASGVVPVFLLARDRLNSSAAGALAGILYLLYPAVQYNGVVDYRPDHLAIPTMLWAYAFAGRGRYLASLGVAGLGGLAKETLILNAAFFGLYLAVRNRQRLLGILAFLIGLAAFYGVAFHLLQFKQISEGQFMMGRYFPDLPSLPGGASTRMMNPAGLVQGLSQTYKWLYLAGLFVPLAFLPLLALPELIPAIPSLAISLLSVNPNYASIEAQYSASIVAPVFAALLAAIPLVGARLGRQRTPVPLLAGLTAVAAFVSFGLAPSVLSLNFWNPSWGGRWQQAQYRPDRQAILNQAVRLLPADPKVVVVTQNDVNSGRLAHRFDFFAFPNAIHRADYVLVDTAREPYVYWFWNPERYQALLRGLRADPMYQIIFDREGVLLFKHRQVLRSDLGAVPPY